MNKERLFLSTHSTAAVSGRQRNCHDRKRMQSDVQV